MIVPLHYILRVVKLTCVYIDEQPNRLIHMKVCSKPFLVFMWNDHTLLTVFFALRSVERRKIHA